MNRHIVRVAVSALFLILCSQTGAQEWGKITQEEWDCSAPGDMPSADAVVLFDRGVLEITTDGITLKRHVRIKVLTKAGINKVGDISIPYRSKDKFKKFKAHTIRPGGKKSAVKRKALRTQSSGRYKVKVFSFPSVEEGAILEYRYENVNRRFGLLDAWYFQDDLYTLESMFQLKLHPGFTYSSVANNVPDRDQKATVEKDNWSNVKTYTWVRRNLLPITDEPYMAAINSYRSALHFQLVSYKDQYQHLKYVEEWSDLGEKFTDWVESYCSKSKKLKETVEKVVDGIEDSRDRARAIYDHVTTTIRCTPDPEGGYFTHESIMDLVELGYGTSDEKNLLLVEMCRLADVTSYPVLIGTRGHTQFNKEIHQLQRFNQIIAYLEFDSTILFLDATTEYCPYGILPARCHTTGGLLLAGKASQIISVLYVQPKTSQIASTHVLMGEDDAAHCSTSVVFTGFFAASYGRRYDSSEPSDFIDRYFLGKLNTDYELLDHSFIRGSEQDECVLHMTYTISDVAEQMGTNMVLKSIAFAFKDNPFKSDERFFPVDFEFPRTYRSNVRYEIGELMEVYSVPADTTISQPGVSFARQSSYTGKQAMISSVIKIERPIFRPDEYTDLRSFFVSVEEQFSQELVLSPSKP